MDAQSEKTKLTADEVKQAMYDLGWAYDTGITFPGEKVFVKFYDNDGKRLDVPSKKTWKEAREFLS